MDQPIYRMPSGDRWEGARPYIGKRCKVTHRSGTYGEFDRTVTGVVLGASYHLTNGNSTGDLIVQADPGRVWRLGAGEYKVVSIGLAHVAGIEVLP